MKQIWGNFDPIFVADLGGAWLKISTIYFGKFFYSLHIISYFDSDFDPFSGLNLRVIELDFSP